MSDRKRSELSSHGLFVPHESFLGVDNTNVDNVRAAVSAESIHRLASINRALVKNPHQYDYLFEREKLSAAEAKKRSELEISAIEVEYPLIAASFPHFANFYLFVRTVELATGSPRGGDKAFIGSGKTTPEVLACYIEAPSKESIVAILSRADAAFVAIANTFAGLDKKPAVVGGQAVAVEPNLRNLSAFDEANKNFGVPEDKVFFIGTSLGEALTKELIPGDLQTIFWNRMDPEIIYPQGPNAVVKRKERREQDRKVDKLLKTFLGKLKPNGCLLITVGTGNSLQEYTKRVRALERINGLLQNFNVEINSDMPNLYEGSAFEAQRTRTDPGIVGCVVAIKTR
ncbi:MAG: hypothetical protein AAB512_02760 [Patescibacteria group bacterium]